LATVLGWGSSPRVSAEEVRLKAEPRLREMKELCDQYGSRLTIVVPPARRQNSDDVLVSLGNDAGIRTLIPEQPGAMDSSFFRDPFHLNPAGAAIFTAKLQSQLAMPTH
jgi:lysophospholipase L1-like esterase